jgi:transposase
MLKTDQINEIHRLAGGEHWSARRIARQLHLAPRTVKKYLATPVALPAHRPRASKLDVFKPLITELLEQDPHAPEVVILQRLRAAGYAGGHTILDSYLGRTRPSRSAPRAFVRMEPLPGERFEIDWGHFDALDYQGDKRKLYAFCLIEAHSRMLYVEFTHSQSFESFARCHQHAFQAFGGVASECWYDNLLTASLNGLVREAFLRGISTRKVGELLEPVLGESHSPQTVSPHRAETGPGIVRLFIGCG